MAIDATHYQHHCGYYAGRFYSGKRVEMVWCPSCLIFSPPKVWPLAEYCDEHVCLCICMCLSVCEPISGTACPIFTIFWSLPWPWLSPPLTASRLRYVLPVLWMTSYNAHNGSYGDCRYRCSEWRHYVVMSRLTPLLRRIGFVIFIDDGGRRNNN